MISLMDDEKMSIYRPKLIPIAGGDQFGTDTENALQSLRYKRKHVGGSSDLQDRIAKKKAEIEAMKNKGN